jgi:hypothetical protein
MHKSNLNITAGNTNCIKIIIVYLSVVRYQSNLNDPDYINDVQYRFNDAYMGVHYKFISGKFTFNPVSIHQYNTNNVQLNSKQEDNFSRFCLMFALPPNQKI